MIVETLTLRLGEVAFLNACSDRSIELIVEGCRRGGAGFIVGQNVLLDRWSTAEECISQEISRRDDALRRCKQSKLKFVGSKHVPATVAFLELWIQQMRQFIGVSTRCALICAKGA